MVLLKTSVLRAVAAATAVMGVMAIGALPAEGSVDRTVGMEQPFHLRECDDVADPSADVRTCTYFFQHTGTVETFVVPPTTGPVQITAVGAPGAGQRGLWSYGATVTGSFTLPSGTPLFVAVGGSGSFDGYNGGGPGGGGGASDVRLGLPDLDHRIIVGGGGGGWGEQLVYDEESGAQRLLLVKGGDAGQSGLGSGGQPGTASGGGAGGGSQWAQGQPGRLGRGGAGAGGAGSFGGGGGGLYGGGGGGGCSGSDPRGPLCVDSQPGSGGGGSSLVPPGGTIAVLNDLHPHVTITLTQPAATILLPWGRPPRQPISRTWDCSRSPDGRCGSLLTPAGRPSGPVHVFVVAGLGQADLPEHKLLGVDSGEGGDRRTPENATVRRRAELRDREREVLELMIAPTRPASRAWPPTALPDSPHIRYHNETKETLDAEGAYCPRRRRAGRRAVSPARLRRSTGRPKRRAPHPISPGRPAR